ncbi:SDR family NAD(P)-dependent oxidoreductase [Cognatishimia sp. 1_MG-2023]|uniref:type I polyketide synthase n=1 Tax=Cognatishimia sp. 1_MG-2023 TaxID=3062642 RepID=UPI0026E20012|nr:type I polyketide synthase [Cognatishimia sp. 1_MG-2023]MDO6725759.1 SDR family NAD(P)-dependent oxidoreductase [Cognatishimia sp. 1_MG-2023]
MAEDKTAEYWNENDIAIVGMAAHLPGSSTLDDYWANLRDGVECITRLTEDELIEAGESPARLRHKNYVPSAAILDDFDKFDADFFGLSPKEAAIMDPQHRKFLEVSWEALETAGHMPENFEGPIGVFGGCGMGSYFYFNICSNRDLVDSTGMFLLRHTGNDKDFLSTRLSHILDLKGPSISVQTACSTSLVAAHYACQSLLNGECDMALAGGVTIELPHKRGYVFEDGEILSPDGHCHAFDHRAQGTVFGSGAGVVVLRRMADALADGDHIWGVIRGSAVNNDGSAKAGYLAPSVDGQATAIAEAQAMADVTADTIDYIECHGTGTYLGDPIEVAALTEAFRETTEDTGFCRIGSVKTNIGHLDTAAGAASLIKASLSLHHKQLAPSLGYEAPNPAIDFETSPFKVNSTLTEWDSHKGPRRAGVNSLGVGGTNAHVVLEEAPIRPLSEEADWPFQLLTISGRSTKALDANAAALAEHLRANPDQPLADVAYTLQTGRRAFEKRRVVVAASHEEAAELLETKAQRRVFSHSADHENPDVVFMFPGGGAQYVCMGQDLYETEPVFQDWMDRGLDILQSKVDYDVRALWLADGMSDGDADKALQQPSRQLPLIMIVEYALAQLWMSWGVTPAVLVGHSMGENTAACLADVMSFEDCIGLVLLRGQLFDSVPAGGMLSVPLSRGQIEPLLTDQLDIAAENAADLTVVSGPQAALDALQKTLADQDVEAQRIPIDIAAHSRMLEPILKEFGAYLKSIQLNAPHMPIISNRTGVELTAEQAMDPDYWVGHLRGTVRFADCISTCSQTPGRVFLEVGPGKALSSLSQMHSSVGKGKTLSSLRHPEEEIEDDLYFVGLLGRLWACGVSIDWDQIWGEARRNRVVLPTYQFQRSRYFIEPGKALVEAPQDLMRIEDMTDWGYRPVWKPRLAECDLDILDDLSKAEQHSWLIFVDDSGVGSEIAQKLRKAGQPVVEVSLGDAFGQLSEDHYVLAPERGREGYDELISDLIANGRAPDRILHMWLLTEAETFRPGGSFFHRNLEQGFYSLMFLGQAMVEENLPGPVHLVTVTSDAAQLRDEGLKYPEKATIRGPLGVMPREIPGVTTMSIDADWSVINRGKAGKFTLANRLIEDLIADPISAQVAYRGEKRFELITKATPLPEDHAIEWSAGQTYFITGGFGGIGVSIAKEMLAAGANVVLQTRKLLPDRAEWGKITQFRASGDKLARQIATVQELEELSGQLLVVAADVNNIGEMRDAVAQVSDKFGEINGVIHAAGVIDDAPMLAKSSTDVEDVLAPKLHGTMVLDQMFSDGMLDWMVLFASTSTVTTPAGQLDYVAANEFLNAYAQSRAGDKTRVIAVNWGIWSDTGMAADSMADRVGTAAVPEQREIAAPFLQKVQVDADGSILFSSDLSNESCWMLDQHRTSQNEAILPGTGYLELVSEAMQTLDADRAYEIRDLMFLRAFHVKDGDTRQLRLKLRQTDAGYDFEILGDYQDGFITHAEGRIFMVALPAPTDVELDAIRARCDTPDLALQNQVLTSPQEAHLNFGPHWKVLKSQSFGDGEGVAELELDPSLAPIVQDMSLHPGLLDLGTGWAMGLIDQYTAKSLWVPVSYGALRHYGTLPSRVVSWVKSVNGSSEQGTASFDIVLTDTKGNVCVEVDRLTIKRLESGFALSATPAPAAAEIQRDQSVQLEQALSPNELRLQHNLSQGIPAVSGPAALRRAMGLGVSQVVVSSLDINGLTDQMAALSQDDQADNQGFERPELETDFVAPSNDVERTLAGFWQDLLGIEQVGVNDSFFDLGGHSLIAVRLFSMVKKAYRIEFPISVLFEAPTITQCANLIIDRIGPQDDKPIEDATTHVPERRFTHIVPMHQAGNSDKTPFFLVAGMYGNVLNLRHLAHLVGADRPFFGLQARGLFGDVAPHDDLAEAATDYIAEIRQVQPQGPYMLGGFSGGGITAYEIAQQLEAMGEEVSLVVMLDTPLPIRRELSREDRLKIQLHELKTGGVGYVLRWAKNRVLWEIQKRRAPDVTQDESGAQFHNAEIESAFYRALPKYQMHSWNGRVALYRPPLVGKWQVGPDRWVNSERTYVLHDNDWSSWTPNLTVTEVPGDHDSMVLEPNVRVLAAHIRKEIEQAESATQVVVPFRKAAE